MNPEASSLQNRDVEAGIADYLKSVDDSLREVGQSTASRTSVLEDLNHQIRTQLAQTAKPTVEDLNRLLAAMDPPEAFREVGVEHQRSRPGTHRGTGLVIGVLVLVIVAAALVWLGQRSSTADTPVEPELAAVPESSTHVTPPTVPQDPIVLPVDETPPTAPAMAIAVSEFATSGNIADADAIRAVISDGLVNAMALTDGLRVVERAKLRDAFAEMKLGAEGLVSQTTALQLGKLTGARVILTGTIARLGDELILTARLINAETGELSAVRVTGDRGELLALVDDLGRRIIARIAQQETGVLARADDGENARLREKQKAVKAALAGHALPRVLVLIPESHLGRRVPDPAAETELVLWLTDAGFQVASPEYEGVHAPSAVQSWTDETDIQFSGRTIAGQAGGLIQISTRALNQLLQPGLGEKRESLLTVADVIILGEGISERGTAREGLISCKARVELKVIAVKSGRVLLAKSDYAAGVDVAEHIAGKRALQAAARTMAPDLIVDMVNAWQEETRR